MISGIVNDRRQGFVNLEIVGEESRTISVRFLLDTGFSGGLTLPQATVQSLGLVIVDTARSQLADGNWIRSSWCRGNVLWDGKVRPASILVTNGPPLLGMTLVSGHQIIVDMIDGGTVTLKRL